MTELKNVLPPGYSKKQLIIRFDDATPDSEGVYSFTLTDPIKNSVYTEWSAASEDIVGKYTFVAQFKNDGQTTANISASGLPQPPAPTPAPNPPAPPPPQSFPTFSDTDMYDAGDVVNNTGLPPEGLYVCSYVVLAFLEASPASYPSSVWNEVTDKISNPEEWYSYDANKVYKGGENIFYNNNWFHLSHSASPGTKPPPPDAVWENGINTPTFTSTTEFYPLNSRTFANPIVYVATDGGKFYELVGKPTTEFNFLPPNYGNNVYLYTDAWLSFTPYDPPSDEVVAQTYFPVYLPAAPTSSYVAGKYWRFINSTINSANRPLPDAILEPTNYVSLSVKIFNIDGSTYAPDAGGYIVVDTWNKDV